MKKLSGLLASIVLLLLLCSGIFADIVKFFTWLFTLQYTTPETSILGSIIVKILTFAVSYTLVGLIFNSLNWFNSKVMSVAYFIVSTLLGFALAYIVMLIETNLLVIGIILGVILITSSIIPMINYIKKSKFKKLDEN